MHGQRRGSSGRGRGNGRGRGEGHRPRGSRPFDPLRPRVRRNLNVLQPARLHLASIQQEPTTSNRNTFTRRPNVNANPTSRPTSSTNKVNGIRPIGYKELESYVLDDSIEPNQIALKLSSEHSGLLPRLEGDINMDWTVLLFKVFEKLCNSEDTSRSAMASVLKQIISSKFIEQKVNTNLLQLLSIRNISNTLQDPAQIQNLLSNCLQVAKSLLLTLPNSSFNTVETLVLNVNLIAGSKNLEDTIWEINQEVTEIMSSLQNTTAPTQNASFKRQFEVDNLLLMHEQVAPDDFRLFSVFPTEEDILCDEVFFRTNLVNSGYRNQDHYLDVQFRLLREDYIRPLREGIQMLQRTGSTNNGFSQNIKSYQDVTIDYPELGRNGVTYWLHFNAEMLSGVRWQNTKRLLFGNLVCLSSDNFKSNFLFAVVVEHDAAKLSAGLVSVEFVFPEDYQTNFDEVETSIVQPMTKSSLPDMNATYTMVETDAYFEAYRHVLSGLQTIKKIPLDMHIVKCEKEMPAPYYLRQYGNSLFDFTSALSDTGGRNKFYILNTNTWPSAQQLGLDPSQADALKTALTNQLAIIQGPPGTGKTHVGLKIMKLLLNNIKQAVVSNGEASSPILVVCYTNHALDQFLEGIAQFHSDGIVRVGGRCKTESLQKYSLRNLKQAAGSSKMQKKTMWEHFRDRDDIKYKMEDDKRVLETTRKKLLQWQFFQGVLSPHVQRQIQVTNIRIEEWLEITESNKPDNFYSTLLKEVLLTLCRKIGKDYDVNHILQAVDCLGTFDPIIVVPWIISNSPIPNYRWTQNLSGIIGKQLQSLKIHDHVYNKLDESGYQKEEAQCAVYVTGSRSIEKLLDWLEKIKKDAEDSQDLVFETQNFNVAEESEFIQEMRMLDIDHTDSESKPVNFEFFKLSQLLVERIFLKDNASAEGKWTKVKPNRNNIKKNLLRKDIMLSSQVHQITDIFSLTLNDRWRLYRYWIKKCREEKQGNFFLNQVRYNQVCKQINELQRDEDLQILKNADVIGMTTTGAAKYMDIVQKLPTKVVIVEEAAEVLEAHIVTAMPKSTEHLILIGDHQQLKPSPTVYELAKKYHLDISLFERMITNGIPYSKLSLQHRMRPQIADLLRIDIYDNLRDNDNVKQYESVKGVQKDVYFITHDEMENNVKDGRSKVNDHEASYLTALCLHLLHQGYLPSEITILAAYTGQLLAFKRLMKSDQFKGVYVTAIDNYQGEENEIILLSLVRSNDAGKIGFLSIENRICVALSRAKKGLYCIGNFTLLQEKSKFWCNIVKKLEEDGSFGDALPMQCYNHKDFIRLAKYDKDFQKFPEGGCGKVCVFRLQCGHTCSRCCHADDPEHQKLPCRKPCLKKCSFGHKCKARCSQICPLCTKKVDKMMPNCGHTQKMECNKDASEVKCAQLVSVDLKCGHRKLVECYRSNQVYDVTMCTEPCSDMLDCGHLCKGNCRDCLQGCLHKRCQQNCKEELFCGHICKEKCSSKCPPCLKKCDNVCEHSSCPEKCSKPCSLCSEKCKWKCGHYVCGQLCSEPCDRATCDLPCPKKLNCGHPCIGLCGEICPKICGVCSKLIGQHDFFNQKITENTRFVQLDCKHLFEYKKLDKYMLQPDIYGKPAKVTEELKKCPQCQVVIRTTRRYGRILKKQMRIINDRKMKEYGDVESLQVKISVLMEKITQIYNATENYDYLQKGRNWEKMLKDESSTQVELVEKQMEAYEALDTFIKDIENFEKEQRTEKYPTTALRALTLKIKSVMTKRVNYFKNWLLLTRQFFFAQEEADFNLEVNRLKDVHKLVFICVKFGNHDIQENLERLCELMVDNLTPYAAYKRTPARQLLSDTLANCTLKDPVVARSYQPWAACWKNKVISYGDVIPSTVGFKRY